MTIILAVHKNDETVIAADTRISFGSEIIPGDNCAKCNVTRILSASGYHGALQFTP